MSFITVTVDWSVGIWNAHTPAVFLIGYALPFVINTFEFSLRTIKEYREDLRSRAEAIEYPKSHFYYPHLTVGHILARILGIVTPFISFIVMIANMDRVFEWIGNIFRFFGRLFDIPLVPKR